MPNAPYRIPLRIVFYREEESWIAHCLEFDLCGDGDSQQYALASLVEAIEIQVAATRDFQNVRNLFRPADSQYHQMFAAGKDIAIGEVQFADKHLVIEGTSSREFMGDVTPLADSQVALA